MTQVVEMGSFIYRNFRSVTSTDGIVMTNYGLDYQLQNQLSEQLRDQIGDHLWEQLWDQLDDQLWEQLKVLLGNQLYDAL